MKGRKTMSDTSRKVFHVDFTAMEKDMWQLNGGTANALARQEQENEIFIFLKEEVGKIFDEFFSKYFGEEALRLFKVVTSIDIFAKFINKESGGSLGHIFYMQIFDTSNVCRCLDIVLPDEELEKLDAGIRLLVGKEAIFY